MRCAAAPTPVGGSPRHDVGELAALQRRHHRRGRTAGATGRVAGLQRLHAHRRGVDRSSDTRRVRADRRAAGTRVATVRARLAGPAARPRHRRHGADSVPSHHMSDQPRRRSSACQGPDRQRRRDPRHPRGRSGAALVEQLTEAGWTSSSTASRPTGPTTSPTTCARCAVASPA